MSLKLLMNLTAYELMSWFVPELLSCYVVEVAYELNSS